MSPRFHCAALCGLLSLAAGVGSTYAQTAAVLSEAHTISGGDATTKVAPVERTLTIANAGSYNVTLTDLKVPSAFSTAMLAVTNGTTLVANVTMSGGTPATAHFAAATPGTYIVHVVAALTSTQTFGTVGVQATNAADGTPVAGFTADNGSSVAGFTASLSLANSAIPSTEHVIDTMITLADSAQHTADLTDLQFPQALQTVQMILTDPNGAVVPGFPLTSPHSQPFTAMPGAYHLVALGQMAAGASGGLYNVRVEGAGGTADVFNETDAVGQVASLGKVTLAAGQDTVAFTDFTFPVPLSKGVAIVTQGSQAVASSPATPVGTVTLSPTFTAAAGDYRIFALAVPTATPGFGGYGVTVMPQGGSAAFSTAQVTSNTSSSATPYAFPVKVPTSGSYNLRLADFQFPQGLTVLQLAAAQNGALLGTPLAAAGTLNVNPSSGDLVILVVAQPAAAGKGVFGVDLTPASGGAATFAVTQGVGAAFGATAVSITTAGSYDVTVSDLAFPVNFTDLSAVVTRGASQLGSIFGGGKFSFTATPGTYFINFLATPAAIAPTVPAVKQTAGTYGVAVAPTPPAPTVTLTASAPQVTSGGTVTLTWSSTNATSCTASGGWNGALGASGQQTSPAITSTTTFTLACTGPSGNASQSVTVTATAGGSGGGGGGSVDLLMLALLAAVATGRLAVVRRAAGT